MIVVLGGKGGNVGESETGVDIEGEGDIRVTVGVVMSAVLR